MGTNDNEDRVNPRDISEIVVVTLGDDLRAFNHLKEHAAEVLNGHNYSLIRKAHVPNRVFFRFGNKDPAETYLSQATFKFPEYGFRLRQGSLF